MFINPFIQTPETQKTKANTQATKPTAESTPTPKGPIDKAMIMTPVGSVYHAFIHLLEDEPVRKKLSGPEMVKQVLEGTLKASEFKRKLDNLNSSQLNKTLDTLMCELQNTDDPKAVKQLNALLQMVSSEIDSRGFFDKLFDPMRNFDTRWILA